MSIVKPGYIIDPVITKKLKRMWVIEAALRSEQGEEISCDDEAMDECRSLREELVAVFLPLVEQLVRAGLLTMSIDLGDEDLSKYSSIAGEGVEAFDNGNIWIDCAASHWVFKPGAAPTVSDESRDRVTELITFWDEIGQQLGAKSRWSLFDEAGTNPDEVGIHGSNLTLVYTDHWGKAGEVKTSMPDNPTWRQMYVAADKLIQESGDENHIFIEQFTQAPEDPNTYLLDTGS